MSYDPKSFEIAEHFLADHDGFSDLPETTRIRMKDELAQSIQDYIEDWINFEIKEAQEAIK